jgi:hypothetical protein
VSAQICYAYVASCRGVHYPGAVHVQLDVMFNAELVYVVQELGGQNTTTAPILRVLNANEFGSTAVRITCVRHHSFELLDVERSIGQVLCLFGINMSDL